MAGPFFGGSFFGGGFFGALSSDVNTGTGGIDPGDAAKRGRIVKPTGILHLPKKPGRKGVAERVDESKFIQAEIAARLAREFGEDTAAFLERERIELSSAQVTAEIGRLLRKKMRTEDDEILLLLLMAVACA